jgi:HEPN domain-containing protein/predicted nucleotidyltransferase
MKTSISFLPEIKQQQILQIVEIIKEVAAPEKIILFGSYAKGKQVEHKYKGSDGIVYEYISDYDFLVVTKHSPISPIKAYELDDEITTRAEKIEPALNIEIHDIEYINEGLEFGQYFFSDIVKEGILLYDTGKVDFAKPKELTPLEEKIIAQRYFDIWFPRGTGFLKGAGFYLSQNELKIAAFSLHQVAESFYYASLLVYTGYKPKTHNLKKLRKQSKDLSEELFFVFPVEKNKTEKHLFDLLKHGYIDARYRTDYFITEEELIALMGRIKKMQGIVEQICRRKIESFEIQTT